MGNVVMLLFLLVSAVAAMTFTALSLRRDGGTKSRLLLETCIAGILAWAVMVIAGPAVLPHETAHAFYGFDGTRFEMNLFDLRDPDVRRVARTILTPLVLFVSMIVGMAANTLWGALENRRGTGAPVIDYWRFVMPLLVSPIVFVIVYRADAQISLASGAFAFQNGFFWQTIFARQRQQQDGPPKPDPAPATVPVPPPKPPVDG